MGRKWYFCEVYNVFITRLDCCLCMDYLQNCYICDSGHDTTTSAISFIMYELARNPDIQEKCQTEVDDIIKDRDTDHIEWFVSAVYY